MVRGYLSQLGGHGSILASPVGSRANQQFQSSRLNQDDSNGSPTRQLKGTTRASLYHVAEHRPARSDSLQLHTERSNRPGPEPSSVEVKRRTQQQQNNNTRLTALFRDYPGEMAPER